MTPNQFAAAHGLDAGVLNSLLEYLRGNLERSAELRQLAERNPREFMEQGVRAWRDAGQKFLSELAFGTSKAAVEMRRQLAEQVWTQIRTEAGLPV